MQLPCPYCGEPTANMWLDLSTGTDFKCCECDAEFGVADIRDLIGKWTAALKWVGTMPTQEAINEAGETADFEAVAAAGV